MLVYFCIKAGTYSAVFLFQLTMARCIFGTGERGITSRGYMPLYSLVHWTVNLAYLLVHLISLKADCLLLKLIKLSKSTEKMMLRYGNILYYAVILVCEAVRQIHWKHYL